MSISPGANLILLATGVPKPNVDGYITRFKPDLVRTDGTVPPVDQIHLHHAVWVNASSTDGESRFFASGEEKTIFSLPDGYGYPVRGSDYWLLNYMVHDLTANPDHVYITYDLDFVPADTPTGKRMKAARPVWLDVHNGSAYPVFDVHRGAGTEGQFTYPDQADNPYAGGPALNEWKVDHAGTLLTAAGHLHPGGLYDEVDLIRPGAEVAGAHQGACLSPTIGASPSRPRSRRPRARRRHRGLGRRARPRPGHRRPGRRRGHPGAPAPARGPGAGPAPQPDCSGTGGPIPGPVAHSVRLFRSSAHYWDPNGPVSWDMGMGATAPDWRVAVRPGDRLRISATYDTRRASWYESMGIAVLWMANDDQSGVNPFTTALDQSEHVTHGPLPENKHYGGAPTGLADPATLPNGSAPASTVNIANFSYAPGDQGLAAGLNDPPVVQQGQSLTFVNQDASSQILHTVTACQQPCTASAGSAFPLANGPVDFDSGDLGYGPPGFTAAAQRNSWQTPRDLPPGTYTYFCRIHPFMRGSFRVIG